MKSIGHSVRPARVDASSNILVGVIAGLWALTSGLAVALYARVVGDHRRLEKRVEFIEQNTAMKNDIAEIKTLIRDNTSQTNDMRKEVHESVRAAHIRIDETNAKVHKVHVEMAQKSNV